MKLTENDESCFLKPHSRKPRNFARKIVARIFSPAQSVKDTGKLGSWTTAAVCLILVATPLSLPAQSFKTLVNFDGTDGTNLGANPEYVSLVQGLDGNLWGTTYYGGADSLNLGTVFKMSPSGKLTTVHSFKGSDGANPAAGLTLGTDGNFYGTTVYGGASTKCSSGCGTVFQITPGGTLTTLHSFVYTDGAYPSNSLVQGTDGNFYGTANNGGALVYGTAFKITPGGVFKLLHDFGNSNAYPNGLVQGTDGNFYGTSYGGGLGHGTVFKMTPGGTVTTLCQFGSNDCKDGEYPSASLIQATDGNFYSTTKFGGANDDNDGTVFKITASGVLTTLWSFDGNDGYNPVSPVVQGTDGNFYGTTYEGGTGSTSKVGTVFKLTPEGTLTTLHSFDGPDGADVDGGLVQYTGGAFYGVTYEGGTSNDGTIFTLGVGLGPFVETVPTSGTEGTEIIILGTNLTGATEVSFNGTAAAFKVVSSSEITTSVPAGATTGTVEVTTPSGTLNSNVAFRVRPGITSFTPTSGAVGTSVTITGTELTQTSRVTFGGVKATTFTVNSDSEVTADVPTGAKTGKIAITTPGGTATSSGSFTVTP